MYARYYELRGKFYEALGYLTIFSNLLACIILIFVIRMVYSMTKKVRFGQAAVMQQRKLSLSITLVHIALIFGFTVVTAIDFMVSYYKNISAVKFNLLWIICCGLSDVFITGNLLFVTDENYRPSVFIDPNTNQPYAMLDVIRRPVSTQSVNDENDESDLLESEIERVSGSVLVSDRMIQQFFKQSVLKYDQIADALSFWPEPNDEASRTAQ